MEDFYSFCNPVHWAATARRPYCCHEEEVVREEGEAVDLAHLLEAVQFHSRVVVHKYRALLGHCKHHLVVQKPGGSMRTVP